MRELSIKVQERKVYIYTLKGSDIDTSVSWWARYLIQQGMKMNAEDEM
jgi:hypothetical protein